MGVEDISEAYKKTNAKSIGLTSITPRKRNSQLGFLILLLDSNFS
jgi:hypothetical protein